jgi:hypothetical protein
VLASAALVGSQVAEPWFFPISLFPLLLWPVGVPFLILFVVSGLGLLGHRRWAPTLTAIALALLLVVEWITCLVTLTPWKWFSLYGLGWVIGAILLFGAMGIFMTRRWMLQAAAIALPTLMIGVWAVTFAGLLVSEPTGRRNIGEPAQGTLPAAVVVAIAVLVNSAFLAYPMAMLVAITRWRLLADATRGKA